MLIDNAEDKEQFGGLQEIHEQLEGVHAQLQRELGSQSRLGHLASLQLLWQRQILQLLKLLRAPAHYETLWYLTMRFASTLVVLQSLIVQLQTEASMDCEVAWACCLQQLSQENLTQHSPIWSCVSPLGQSHGGPRHPSAASLQCNVYGSLSRRLGKAMETQDTPLQRSCGVVHQVLYMSRLCADGCR